MIERTVFMLLAICGCFSFQPFAFADVYQGYIGRYPVVMHFAFRDPETIQGRYFYTRIKQDILLIGHETKGTETSKNDDITLTSKETGDKFWLKRHGDGYQGIFENKAGEPLSVTLTQVQPSTVKNPLPLLDFAKSSDYEKLRFADVALIPGKKETVNGKYFIQWYSDPYTELTMFRVISGYPADVLTTLNRELEIRHYIAIHDVLQCVGNDGLSGAKGWTVSSYFFNEKWVSYGLSLHYKCLFDGAPRGDTLYTNTLGVTLDPKTGEQVPIERIFWVTPEIKQPNSAMQRDDYLKQIYAPTLVEIFQRLYPQHMKVTNDCDYANPEFWIFGNWYLTNKGLYVGAKPVARYSHCKYAPWSIIPFDVLKQYYHDID